MSEGLTPPEQEPTVDAIAQQNRDALERARLDPDLADMVEELVLTTEDEDMLYREEGGELVDLDTAWGNTVGWWMQLGLDPVDYFEPGFIEKLGVE